MIDLATEQLIAFRQVPKRLPPRPNGKTVHVSVVYRWGTRGIKGVVLESIRIGGTTYTSVEALQRFADCITAKRHDSSVPTTHMTRARQVQARLAAQEVRRQLGLKQSSPDSTAEKSLTPELTYGEGQQRMEVPVRKAVDRFTNSKHSGSKEPQPQAQTRFTE